MDKTRVFCAECRRDVGYTIHEVSMEGSIREETYSYFGKEAHCEECGAEIFLPEIHDDNLKALYDAFREKNDIVSLEIIRAIPDKYAIGKRPLSLLLGWGEQTFSRYFEGDIPTQQYSKTLQEIYQNPHYFSEILEKNKENLRSTKAYEKSKKAVNTILGFSGLEIRKIEHTVEYLLEQCEDVTPLALQKALYYIQGFHYAFYGEFPFSEDCEAWVHGPVYREIFEKYRVYRYDPIKKKVPVDFSGFPSTEKAIMDSVIKNVCCYSAKVLEMFTHSETPWLETRGNLPLEAASNKRIQKELIGSYFHAVKEKYQMINPNDIKSYAQAMFEMI